MKEKLNVILDLDQTLISGEEYELFEKNPNKEKMNKFFHAQMKNYFIIFARPHLQEFLDFLFENFNVAVWTAASKDYANFIVKNFILTESKKNKRKLDFIFYSYHCNMSKRYKQGLKSLSMLWDVFKLKNYNPNNTIIVDDNSDVVIQQSCNVIQIKPFYYQSRNSDQDKELLKVMAQLKTIDNYMKEDVKKGKKGENKMCIARDIINN